MPVRLELQGKQFGEWDVGKYLGDSLWECKCSCGTVKEIKVTQLTSGKSKNCGCIKKTRNRDYIRDSLDGMTFEDWHVMSHKGRGYYECKCTCGEIKIVSGTDLRNGKSKSCGHSKKNARIDLTKKTFGEWEVLRYTKEGYWDCKCSCGVIKNILGYNLLNGLSRSCGHNLAQSRLDITGKKFGDLTALSYVGNGSWKCICSCGEEVTHKTGTLTCGYTNSCGCKQHSFKENLIGKTFGGLTVIEYAGNGKWTCGCSCGNNKDISTWYLTRGYVKDCGHNRNNIIDIKGQIFGELVVVKYLGNRYWECKCSCGNTARVYSGNIRSGGTISCGCKYKSKLTKDNLLKFIEIFKNKKGELPFADDIALDFGVTELYIKKLVYKYKIQMFLNSSFGSKFERQVYEYINQLAKRIVIYKHNRDIIGNGKELDFYLPDFKLAIEVNGDYWHSSEYKEPDYHRNKTLDCAKRGIKLIHIFEHEWADLKTRIKIESMLKHKLNNTNTTKIFARKCEIQKVNKDTTKEFLDTYHLQGYIGAKESYGVYYNNKLISLMTFRTPRFNTNYDYELIRYCVDPEYTVVGGAERLFSQFIKKNNPNSVLTYCDISKFTGNVYSKLGFTATLNDITKPNYKWVTFNNDDIVVHTRYQTQKQKLIQLGLGAECDTEEDIMYGLGYVKLYDSGNLRLSWYKR